MRRLSRQWRFAKGNRSEGKYINIPIYKDAIEQVMKSCGPIDHFIGHSLGGISIAMIAETITKELPTFHQVIEKICLKNKTTLALFVESIKATQYES